MVIAMVSAVECWRRQALLRLWPRRRGRWHGGRRVRGRRVAATRVIAALSRVIAALSTARRVVHAGGAGTGAGTGAGIRSLSTGLSKGRRESGGAALIDILARSLGATARQPRTP